MTGITLLRIISPTLIWENISLSLFEIVFEILIKVLQVIFFENTLENKENKKTHKCCITKKQQKKNIL